VGFLSAMIMTDSGFQESAGRWMSLVGSMRLRLEGVVTVFGCVQNAHESLNRYFSICNQSFSGKPGLPPIPASLQFLSRSLSNFACRRPKCSFDFLTPRAPFLTFSPSSVNARIDQAGAFRLIGGESCLLIRLPGSELRCRRPNQRRRDDSMIQRTKNPT